jgi:hypothetical protein
MDDLQVDDQPASPSPTHLGGYRARQPYRPQGQGSQSFLPKMTTSRLYSDKGLARDGSFLALEGGQMLHVE